MMQEQILQVVTGLPVEGPFDYRPPEGFSGSLAPGQRVIVPFGRRREMGYIVGVVSQSTVPSLKAVIRVLDAHPIIDPDLMALARWMAAYYGCSVGEAIEKMIPFGIRHRKSLALSAPAAESRCRQGKAAISVFLSLDEDAAWRAVLERARECLSRRQGVLFLAPDAQASQRIVERVASSLGQAPARLDQGTSKEQTAAWLAVKNGEAGCAVGLRSAVFAPIRCPGLVVVFQEHHYGYQEDQSPFYHARDVILERARIQGCDVIFMTPAPTVELWSGVSDGRFELIRFEKSDPVRVTPIDLTNYKPRKDSALSFPVASAVSQALEQRKKVLVIFNRRGMYTVIKCEHCGHVLRCPRCQANLSYHEEISEMVCPSCDTHHGVIRSCPECRHAGLNRYGEGVERVRHDLARFFPQARLAVFDRESRSFPHQADIVVATQAVIKMLDRVCVDLAVLPDVDAELSRHDFRSHQAVFSMVMDLAKVVRDEVFVQTRQPGHPALRWARSFAIQEFYDAELRARQELGFPPARHLFQVMVRAKNEEHAQQQADMIYEKFLALPHDGFEVMPPQPGFQAKLRDQYRYIIMAQAPRALASMAHIKTVLKAVKKKRGVIVTVHVDP